MAAERRVEVGDPSGFTYRTQAEVFQALNEIGYSTGMIHVDAFYFDETKRRGVGVRVASPEECEGRFGALRGVNQVEAAAQTLILLMREIGRMGPGDAAFFDTIQEFRFIAPVAQGDTVNFAIQAIPQGMNKRQIAGMVDVVAGDELVSQGLIVGAITSPQARDRLIMAAGQRHQNQATPTLFQFKG